MSLETSSVDPLTFKTFGELLRYLRRREQLTQRDLGLAVGYSEGHINRFEKNKRLPDPMAVAALFIPALHLTHNSKSAARLMELSMAPQPNEREAEEQEEIGLLTPEPIPDAPQFEIRREQEAAEISACLRRNRRVALCGMAGMGKTTLGSAAAREISRTLPVFWMTLTAGINTSVDIILRQIAFFLVAHGCQEAQPALPSRTNVRVSVPVELKISMICSGLAQCPALLCFDNAELLANDEACLQLLRHIGASTPALILLTSRERLPLPDFDEITIDGMSAREGSAYVAGLGGTAIEAPLAERLVHKTDGNPMLLRLAIGRWTGDAVHAEQFIAHLESQPQIASYLLETVQRQSSPGAWRVAQILGVLQQPANLYEGYLVELSLSTGGVSDMGSAIQELQRRHLIENGAYAFLHPLLRDYALMTLMTEPALQQRLHRLAAEWFHFTRQDALRAAMHYHQAGLLDMAVDVIEENHYLIVERGQSLEAVAVLDEIQEKLKRQRGDPEGVLRRLLVVRADLLRGTLRVAEGEANLRQAAEMTQVPALRAYTLYLQAEIRAERSDYNETLRLAQAAARETDANDLLMRARLIGLEFMAYCGMGDFEHGEAIGKTALQITEQLVGYPKPITGEIRTRILIDMANIHRMRRDQNASMAVIQSALREAREAGLPRQINLALAFCGGLYYDLGDLNESVRYRSQALDGLLKIGDVHSAAYMQTQLADIHYTLCETGQALDLLERAGQTLRVVHDYRGLAATESTRTSCLMWLGKIDEARRVIDAILLEAEGKGTERLWGYRLNKQAIVQLVQGRPDQAEETLQRALALPSKTPNVMMKFEIQSTLALACAVRGQAQAAQEHLAGAPRFSGLSRSAEIDRDLIEAFINLAAGDTQAALDTAQAVAARAGAYPIHVCMARQLAHVAQTPVPTLHLPRYLWVCQDVSPSRF